MNMKRIFFFATPIDAAALLDRFEDNAPLKFIEMGNLETPSRETHTKSSKIPNIGISTNETGSGSKSYLVTYRDSEVHINNFIGTYGENRWSLSNGENENTVILTLAGIWRTGTLLPGNMSTLHETKQAQKLMRSFLSSLEKERFIKIELWWVGPEAMKMLKNGKRLSTTAQQSPSDYDLRIPDLQ
jgi:hypothetical protein